MFYKKKSRPLKKPGANHSAQKDRHEIDEPDTVRFIAKVREKCIIGDDEWHDVFQRTFSTDSLVAILQYALTKYAIGV
ncbi:MAG: hypothetical protein AVO38_11400 [delta proteobacterium ML8_D]|nr:MAG: hypothetical protein AVO38_11400 [delta proteobacterium ML8_D]